ncbi:MAG: metal-sulfur cluster assembly factor [Gemmatimonadetes bacterium]|nr:metal-sulfur cluster assembly factor [Gemmatimonadota bacterium]
MNLDPLLAETLGERPPLPPPPEEAESRPGLAGRAWRALYEVADPELPLSIADLGLVREVTVNEHTGLAFLQLTFTATACPCMDFIEWDIRKRLLQEDGIEQIEIEVVWDPPWTASCISERGREILGGFGVAA